MPMIGGYDPATDQLNVNLATALDAATDSVEAKGVAYTTSPTAVAHGTQASSYLDPERRQMVRHGNQADVRHVFYTGIVQAANTLAIRTQPAPGAGLRNVVTGFVGNLVGSTTAPAALVGTLTIEDGDGNPLWREAVSLPAVAGHANRWHAAGLWLPTAAQNKLVGIHFSGAGGANTFESVWMQGVVIAE